VTAYASADGRSSFCACAPDLSKLWEWLMAITRAAALHTH
jgi:hypothetical protein